MHTAALFLSDNSFKPERTGLDCAQQLAQPAGSDPKEEYKSSTSRHHVFNRQIVSYTQASGPRHRQLGKRYNTTRQQ
jgi:hypothetical protein